VSPSSGGYVARSCPDGSGRTRVTRVPEGREPMVSSPPASSAWAYIALMPKPRAVVAGSNPCPSSRTSPTRRPSRRVSVTRAHDAPLCLATLCSASRRIGYATRSVRLQARRGPVRSSTSHRIPTDARCPAVAARAARRPGSAGAGRAEPRTSSRSPAISSSRSRRRSSPSSRGSGPGPASAWSTRMRAIASDCSTVSWSRCASQALSGAVIGPPEPGPRTGRRCPAARPRRPRSAPRARSGGPRGGRRCCRRPRSR
jgi:hypothetical protein